MFKTYNISGSKIREMHMPNCVIVQVKIQYDFQEKAKNAMFINFIFS